MVGEKLELLTKRKAIFELMLGEEVIEMARMLGIWNVWKKTQKKNKKKSMR